MNNNTGNDVAELLRRMAEEVAVPVAVGDEVSLPRAAEAAMGTGAASLVSSEPRSSSLASLVSQTSGGGAESWVSWVNPLIGGLVSLFGGGGGEDQAPAVLAPFAMPARQSYQAGFAESDGRLMMPLDRGADGQVRNVGSNVVVQVEAMDSRSFVDRAPEIAQAVKRAFLESQGLSGVMREF